MNDVGLIRELRQPSRAEVRIQHQAADRIEALTAELSAERALADQLAEFVASAEHDDGCNGRFNDPPYEGNDYRCKCGLQELRPIAEAHLTRRSPKEPT